MNSDIVIREAGPGDVPGARRFMLGIIGTEYPTGYRPEWHGDIDQLADSYLANPRQRLFVALHGSELVGTAVIRHRAPHAAFPGRYDAELTCELGRVFVAPVFRRKGVALRLIEAARQWAQAKGYRTVSLHTETTNAPAVALWSRLCKQVDAPHGDTVFFELPIDEPIPTVLERG